MQDENEQILKYKEMIDSFKPKIAQSLFEEKYK